MSRFGGIPVDTPPRFGGTPVEEDEPNIVERSYDRLRLAAGDIMETWGVPRTDAGMAFGPGTYGRYGDPSAPDDLNPLQKLVKAAGGDALPAIGDVVGDAVISTGKAVLPKSIKIGDQRIGEIASKGLEVASTFPPLVSAREKLDEWKESDPGSHATAKEALNILAAASPTKAIKGIEKLKASKVAKQTKHADDARANAIAMRQRPDEFTPLKPEVGRLKVKGASERVMFEPGPALKEQADILSDIRVKFDSGGQRFKDYNPKLTRAYDPKKPAAYNFDVTTKAVDDMRLNLDVKLKDVDPIKLPDYERAKKEMLDALMKEPDLVGDSAVSAQRIVGKLDDIIASKAKNGDLTAVDLMNARRELDGWLTSRGVVLGQSGNLTARKLASSATRDMLNDLVIQMAPDADVANDLRKMHQIMKARSTLAIRALGEEGTGKFMRYIHRLEEDTGLTPPRTPASLRANLDLGSGIVAGSIALGHHGVNKVRGMPKRNMLSAERLMAEALSSGVTGAQRGALLDILNEDETEVPYRRQ